jgi:hypothetical protein
MWAGNYWASRYWAGRFWAKVGEDAAEDVCGTMLANDLPYVSMIGSLADYRMNGSDSAYVKMISGDEPCE